MADMTALVQNALENRNLKVVEPEAMPVVPFDVYTQGGDKLGRYYSELGADEDDVPIFRATVGLGGSRDFNITTGIEDLDKSSPSICGVVFYAHNMNVFFDEATPGEPPVCVSKDGITGFDRNTEETCDCTNCPRNKPKNGGRRECRNKVRLYVLTSGTPVPMAIDVPPASLMAWKKYKSSLRHFGFLEPHEVLTEFTLEAAVNAQKIKYSKIKLRMLGKLEPEAVQKIELIQQFFKPEIFEADFEEINNND
jgi:hypothetical protein